MATPEEIANEVFADEEETQVIEEEAPAEEAPAEEAPEEEAPEEEAGEEIPIEMNETNYMDVVDSNITEMMKYNKNIHSDDNYLRYNDLLHQYFAKETKKTKFDRSYTADGYLLASRANKANRIRITPSTIVDLNQYRNKLQREIDRLLYEIVQLMESSMIKEEDHVTFDRLKSQYITYRKQMKEIEDMEVGFQETCRKLEEKISTTLIELKVIGVKRKSAYEAIYPSNQTLSITYEIKKKVMTFYQSVGLEIPDASQINRFSKENEIPTEVIEGLLSWFDVTQAYMKKEIEHKEAVTKLYQEVVQHEAIFQFFILQKPRIEKI
jgi:hypothetical protein